MSYRECRELFRAGLVDAIGHCVPLLKQVIDSADASLFPINGFALCVLPWHGQAGIAFRVQSDPSGLEVAEWEHFQDFFDIAIVNSQGLADAGEYCRQTWEKPPANLSHLDIAHLIFLAGAEALLDSTVLNTFYEVLDSLQDEHDFASQFSFDDQLSAYDGWFQYLVTDPDGNCRANYCDIVRANQVSMTVSPHWQ